MQPCRLPPTRCALSIGRCACRCSRASSPRRARRCRSPGPCRTPTHCSGTKDSSASRPARPPRPAAASPSGPSAGSTTNGRRSPGSCWDSPATTRSRRVSRPPTPWSTASPAIHGAKGGLCRIYGDEPWHRELRPGTTRHRSAVRARRNVSWRDLRPGQTSPVRRPLSPEPLDRRVRPPPVGGLLRHARAVARRALRHRVPHLRA
jgi:hypothetical protein